MHAFCLQHVYPEVTAVNYELPPDCPLRPDLDLYAPYEAAKKKIKRDLWQCKLCNKQFKAEGYLDRHIASKHQDDLPTVRRGLCCLYAFSSVSSVECHVVLL